MTTTDLDLRLLRYFDVLSEELHFGRAAERLHITQSPLSKAIQQLEAQFGLTLFERDSKHVALTPVGLVMLERARETLLHASKTAMFAHSVSQGRTGKIEIGFTALMLYRQLGRLMHNYQALYPEMEIRLSETVSQRQIEYVKSGNLDAGFINSPIAPRGLESLCMSRESYVACIPSNHTLAHAKQIPLEALQDETFLMFSRDSSQSFHDQIMSMCAKAGFVPNTLHYSGQVLTLVSLVGAGFGVTVVPECARNACIPDVSFVALTGSEPQATSYFIWNKDRPTLALPSLIAMLRAVL